MSYSKKDSPKSKLFESSLEWNILNFNDYSKQDIGSITSRKVQIEGTDVYWILHVHPNGYHSPLTYDDSSVGLSLQLHCENPALNHCFSIQVKTVGAGHQLITHDHDESVYTAEYTSDFDAAPHKMKPIIWNVDYENINKRHHFELYKEDFIKTHDLPKYLFDGSLKLLASVSTKFVEIDKIAEANIDHRFY